MPRFKRVVSWSSDLAERRTWPSSSRASLVSLVSCPSIPSPRSTRWRIFSSAAVVACTFAIVRCRSTNVVSPSSRLRSMAPSSPSPRWIAPRTSFKDVVTSTMLVTMSPPWPSSASMSVGSIEAMSPPGGTGGDSGMPAESST